MKGKFAVLFALLMLVCLFVTVTQWIEIDELIYQKEDRQLELDLLAGRLRFQQQEYNMLLEELPGLQENNKTLLPEAEKQLALEKDLKAQRRKLRKEVEALTQEAADAKCLALVYQIAALEKMQAE